MANPSLARIVGNLGNVLSTSGSYATQPASLPVLDSSSNLATTAFVKAVGKTYSNYFSFSANTTLSTSHAGGLISSTTPNLTITLPTVGSCPTATVFTFFNSLTTGNIVIRGNVNELISSIVSPAGSNTFTLYPGESVEITSKSTNWVGNNYLQLNSPILGSPSITTVPPQFDNSLKIPSTSWFSLRGIQWGTNSRATTAANTTLTLSDVGSLIYFNGANQSAVLPNTATIPVGAVIGIQTNGSKTLTISTFNNVAILDDGNGVHSSITLNGGEDVILTYLNNIWVCVGTFAFRVSWLQSQLTAETNARTTADTNLGNFINTESQTRSQADTGLQTQITAETQGRVSVDTDLQSQLNAIRSVYGIGSFNVVQRSAWAGGWGAGGVSPVSGWPGSWQLTSVTQVSGDDFGIAYRYA